VFAGGYAGDRPPLVLGHQAPARAARNPSKRMRDLIPGSAARPARWPTRTTATASARGRLIGEEVGADVGDRQVAPRRDGQHAGAPTIPAGSSAVTQGSCKDREQPRSPPAGRDPGARGPGFPRRREIDEEDDEHRKTLCKTTGQSLYPNRTPSSYWRPHLEDFLLGNWKSIGWGVAHTGNCGRDRTANQVTNSRRRSGDLTSCASTGASGSLVVVELKTWVVPRTGWLANLSVTVHRLRGSPYRPSLASRSRA